VSARRDFETDDESGPVGIKILVASKTFRSSHQHGYHSPPLTVHTSIHIIAYAIKQHIISCIPSAKLLQSRFQRLYHVGGQVASSNDRGT